ncbi:hypothetical protein B7P43_G11383 [Cryptotermes secundus]|uniref:Tc1-like transposase DDE domain-containing protein n=1 Tax=Cryptotermes secundus TaxID=105785 RepID=A0A2J7QXC7_9NEOP|nr:hypothetical protein B7P43_G11383 [Cryptotermes secundus]
MAHRQWHGTIHSEAREVIANIVEICNEEELSKHLLLLLPKATERAAVYAGVSYATVKNIRKEDKKRKENDANRWLQSPGKKRRHISRSVVCVDDFDICIIRNEIHNFYIQEKRVPTIPKLLPIIKSKISFPWGGTSLRRIIKSMGFRWRRCQSKRKILIERQDIVNWRSKYLVKIKQYREEGRSIVYIDETWVDSNLTLIILHAGFIPEAKLFYKAGGATDNAPYHCVQIDKPPMPYSLKKDMISWLRHKGVDCNESMWKNDLYNQILSLKPKEKVFKINSILSGHGHSVIRLPLYMCDLDPIELAWAKIKWIVREHNETADLSLAKLLEVTNEAIQEVTADDWAGFCHHVESQEKR